MSKTIPPFRVTIVGDSAEEVRQRMREFIGDKYGPPPEAENEQPERPDFLTSAAEQPSAPLAPVSIPKENSSGSFAAATTDTFDTRGLPWDHRIHASSKDQTTKGEWRRRRGVEDHHVAAVEQELIARIKASSVELPPPVSLAQPVAAGLAIHPSSTTAQLAHPTAAPVLPFPASVAPPAPPQMPNAHTPQTFKQHIVPIFAKLAKDGRIDQPYVQNLKNHFGVQEIHLVNDEQAAGLFKTFVECGLIQAAQ